MVSATHGVSNIHSDSVPTAPTPPVVSGRQSTSVNRNGSFNSNRLEVVRSDLSSRGFSPEVVHLLLAGVRPTTQTAYQSSWTSWSDWCVRRGVDPLSNAINNGLEFLSYMFNGKLIVLLI